MRERPVEAYLQHADAGTALVERAGRLAERLGGRPHHDDDALRLGVAGVFDEPVAPAGDPGEAVHRGQDERGHPRVRGVARLARLEERVGVVRGAAHERAFRIERARSMGAHEIVVDHRAQLCVVEQLDRRDLVRGAEPVEEMDDRDARGERRRLRDEREIVRLLHRSRGEEGEARRTRGHHVGVIAEDR